MWFHSLLTFWKSDLSRSRRSQPRPARRGTRLLLEHLEDRSLPSSYSAANVTQLIADINAANIAGGGNTITLTARTTSPYLITAVNNSTDGGNGLPVIAANDNLTIVGNGDIVNAQQHGRLFDVASGSSLTLENLTLENGFAAGPGGGAIYDAGTLLLNGVTVQHNQANTGALDGGGAGGGICSVGGFITLEGGTIIYHNQAGFIAASLHSMSISEDGWGGGLYAQNSTVTVTNATLDYNAAIGLLSAYGGGLYALQSTVTLSNATLNNNTAEGEGRSTAYGGGLFASTSARCDNPNAGPSTVSVSNSTLDNNSVAGGTPNLGGGLYVFGGTVNLANDMVKANKGGEGGGLFVSFAGATLTNDVVQSNTGRGVCVNESTVTLGSDTVESNTGGGIYVSYNSTATLTNDTIESNTGTGGIYIASGGTINLDSFTVANTINNTDSSGLNGPTANIDGTYILT